MRLHLFVLAISVWFGSGVQMVLAEDARPTFRDCPQCPEMVEIPAGSFLMGSPRDEEGRGEDEGPQHWVEIPRPLAVSRFEVTFDDWEACIHAGGCDHAPGDVGWGRGVNPVIHVSWEDAQVYLSWLAAETGFAWRLPTEAEWEYFARAGTTTAWHTGGELRKEDANFDTRTASDRAALVSVKAVQVGQYPPNAFGLHDIHGNVSEWVQDCYSANSYAQHSGYPIAVPDTEGCRRIARGGTSHYSATYARSANRSAFVPRLRSLDVGFRVVREVGPDE